MAEAAAAVVVAFCCWWSSADGRQGGGVLLELCRQGATLRGPYMFVQRAKLRQAAELTAQQGEEPAGRAAVLSAGVWMMSDGVRGLQRTIFCRLANSPGDLPGVSCKLRSGSCRVAAVYIGPQLETLP